MIVLKRNGWHRGLVACALTLTVLTCSVRGQQTQTIDAKLAGQSDKWDETPQSGVPCMQTYSPHASLIFDVTVPAPGAVYKVSLSLVKVTNGGYLKVFLDDELQTEVDTLVPSNVRETILVCERFIAPGKHSLKIKNFGQKTSKGGNHLSVIGFEIVGPSGSGKWEIEEKVFSFTPLKQEEVSGQANLHMTELPPRLQAEPFSIPPDSHAADIFSHSLVQVNKIPFRIPAVQNVPETGRLIEEQRPLEIDLPAAAREICLLIWSKIPLIDGDGGPGKPPIAPIDQSERFTAEIVYEDGASEHFIPRNVTTKSYGLDDGLSLYVLYPGAGRSPGCLILHDKVYKCSFAVVAVTCNTDEPVLPEPGVRETCAWYPFVDKEFPAVTRDVRSELAAKLAAMTPGSLSRVFFASGGSEANETALKIARAYHHRRGEHGRYKIISRQGSYHGATGGVVWLGSQPQYPRTDLEPAPPGMLYAPQPNHYRCPFGSESPRECAIRCAEAIESMIQLHGPETVAAVVAEPIASAPGRGRARRRVLAVGTGDLQQVWRTSDRR